jgi:hypothetical protein
MKKLLVALSISVIAVSVNLKKIKEKLNRRGEQ